MLEKVLEVGSAVTYVATEMCLEIRQIALEVFAETLQAIIAAIY